MKLTLATLLFAKCFLISNAWGQDPHATPRGAQRPKAEDPASCRGSGPAEIEVQTQKNETIKGTLLSLSAKDGLRVRTDTGEITVSGKDFLRVKNLKADKIESAPPIYFVTLKTGDVLRAKSLETRFEKGKKLSIILQNGIELSVDDEQTAAILFPESNLTLTEFEAQTRVDATSDRGFLVKKGNNDKFSLEDIHFNADRKTLNLTLRDGRKVSNINPQKFIGYIATKSRQVPPTPTLEIELTDGSKLLVTRFEYANGAITTDVACIPLEKIAGIYPGARPVQVTSASISSYENWLGPNSAEFDTAIAPEIVDLKDGGIAVPTGVRLKNTPGGGYSAARGTFESHAVDPVEALVEILDWKGIPIAESKTLHLPPKQVIPWSIPLHNPSHQVRISIKAPSNPYGRVEINWENTP